jgi:hypothetical protein
MAWNARNISDYERHRRRNLLACFGMIAAAMLFFGGLLSLAEGGRSARDILAVVWALIMLAYFGSMAARERRLMRAERQQGS